MKTPLQRIRLGALVLGVIFLVAVLGYRFLGNYGWVESMWMVVVTISTVGYGERSDLSAGLQLFTIFVILIGMSAAAYTFGGLFQMLLEGEIERLIGTRRMTREIEKLHKHVIICGFGRMGQNLANELREQHHAIVIIEKSMKAVEAVQQAGFLAVHGDATEENLLETVHVDAARCLVTCLPSDADSVFITLTARNLNPDLQIIARAEHISTEKKLRQAGADRVVMPAIVGARHMLRMITRPSTADLMEMVGESSFTDLELDEVIVAKESHLVGHTVRETEAHRRFKLLVVAVKREDGTLLFNPDADHRFAANNTLMIMGHSEDILRFRSEFAL